MEGRDISHDDSGPSFEDIAAARRQVQRSQESLLKKQLPGEGAHASEQASPAGHPDPVQRGLASTAALARKLQEKGHEAQHGAPMATPTPLPGHEASPAAHGPGQVLEAAAGEAPAAVAGDGPGAPANPSTDAVGTFRAHSVVEGPRSGILAPRHREDETTGDDDGGVSGGGAGGIQNGRDRRPPPSVLTLPPDTTHLDAHTSSGAPPVSSPFLQNLPPLAANPLRGPASGTQQLLASPCRSPSGVLLCSSFAGGDKVSAPSEFGGTLGSPVDTLRQQPLGMLSGRAPAAAAAPAGADDIDYYARIPPDQVSFSLAPHSMGDVDLELSAAGKGDSARGTTAASPAGPVPPGSGLDPAVMHAVTAVGPGACDAVTPETDQAIAAALAGASGMEGGVPLGSALTMHLLSPRRKPPPNNIDFSLLPPIASPPLTPLPGGIAPPPAGPWAAQAPPSPVLQQLLQRHGLGSPVAPAAGGGATGGRSNQDRITFQAAAPTIGSRTSVPPSPAMAAGGNSEGGMTSLVGSLLSHVVTSGFCAAARGPGDAGVEVSESESRPKTLPHQAYEIHDSNQTLNMGPEDPTSASTSNAPTGGLTMALGGLGDKIVGAVDGAAEKFAALMGDSSDKPHPGVTPDDLPGMPGSTPADHEYWRLREQQAEAHKAEIEAARSRLAQTGEEAAQAERAGDAQGVQAAGEAHAETDSATIAPPAQEGGAGSGAGEAEGGHHQHQGVFGKLADKVKDVLHLSAPAGPQEHDFHSHIRRDGPAGSHAGPGGEGSPHQQDTHPPEYEASQGRSGSSGTAAPSTSAKDVDVPQRAPGPPGTPEIERPPVGPDRDDVRRQMGIPVAAQRNAERTGDLNTKQQGQAAPSGAIGQVHPNSDEYVSAVNPQSSKVNFFEEVEKRGLGDVVSTMASNAADALKGPPKDQSSQGAPAPWSVSSGAVSNAYDITRNVERADHLDDPKQKAIYDAETYKVGSQHPKVSADHASEAEGVKEATSAAVLGKNKGISGAVPHAPTSGPPKGASAGEGADKMSSDQSMFRGIGTAKGTSPQGHTGAPAGEVRRAQEPFLQDQMVKGSDDDSHSAGSGGGFFSRILSAVMPSAKAVGAGAAGTPTGTDRTQKPPTADYGDNTSGRPPRPAEAGNADIKGPPAAGGSATPKAKVLHAATAGEEPITHKDNTPERFIVDQLKSTFQGGPEEAGIKRSGVDEPGSYKEVVGDAAEKLSTHAKANVEALPDSLSRAGEAVGGVVQHVVEKASDKVKHFPLGVFHEEKDRESEPKRMAREFPGGEDEAYKFYTDPAVGTPIGKGAHDLHSGAIMSELHKEQLDIHLRDPSPARKRETLKDKWLYPFSKDAGDPTNAIEQAKSYYEYVEEKAHRDDQVEKKGTPESVVDPKRDDVPFTGTISTSGPNHGGPVEGSSPEEAAQKAQEKREEEVRPGSVAPEPAGEKQGAEGEGEAKEHHHHGGLRGLVSSAVNTVKHLGEEVQHSVGALTHGGKKHASLKEKGGSDPEEEILPAGAASSEGDKKYHPPGTPQPRPHATEHVLPWPGKQGEMAPAGSDEAKRLEGLPPAEAARLHERMHTYANPKLQELPDTEKGGAGIEGGKYAPQGTIEHVLTKGVAEPVKEAVHSGAEAVAQGTSDLLRGTQKNADRASDAVAGAAEDVKESARQTANQARDAVDDARESARRTADQARGAVDDARESARRTADDTRRATDDTARDARDKAGRAVDEVKGAAKEAKTAVTEGARGAAGEAHEALDDTSRAAQERADSAQHHARGLFADAKHAVGERVEAAKDTVKEAWEDTKHAISDTFHTAKDSTQRAADDTRRAVDERADRAGDNARGAWEDTKRAASETGDRVKGAASEAGDRANRAADNAGDSSRSAWEDTKRAVGDTVERVKGAAAETGDKIKGAWEDTKQRASEQADRARDSTHRAIDDTRRAADERAGNARGAWEDTKQAVGERVDSAKENVRGTWEDTKSAAKDKADSTRDSARRAADDASRAVDERAGAAQERADAHADKARQQLHGAREVAGENIQKAGEKTAEAVSGAANKLADFVIPGPPSGGSSSAPGSTAPRGRGTTGPGDLDLGVEVKERAHEARRTADVNLPDRDKPAPIRLLDSAALLAGSIIGSGVGAVESLLSPGSRRPEDRPAGGHASPRPHSAGLRDPNRPFIVGAEKDDVGEVGVPGSQPASKGLATGAASALREEGLSMGGPPAPGSGDRVRESVDRTTEDARRRAGEAGSAASTVAGRVVGTLGALLGMGPSGAPESGDSSFDKGVRQGREGLEPAGPVYENKGRSHSSEDEGGVLSHLGKPHVRGPGSEHGGYGIADEEGHVVTHEQPPSIPVVPYTSTEEILAARARGEDV